jgi:multidrug efflux pump
MLARFFIDRPVLAWVISAVIILLGAIAVGFLPVAEYPEITPPTVRVSGNYPGANAQVVADTVAAPIEQQVVGVEGMLYMSSQSNNDGSYTLDVTFELGTNVNLAQVLVQNRVAIAEPTLPDVVRAIGVTTKKRSPDILLGISLFSDDNPETGQPYYDSLYLSNYATIHIKDAVARVEGVGDVTILGQQDYSMRIWIDPDKLQSRNLTIGDVIRVLREQNVQVAAGQIGQPPVPKGQDFQYTLSTLGRLIDAEQFANIILKTGAAEEVTYLRDVSRTELGARSQDTLSRLDRRPSSGVAVFLLPGANALETADRIQAAMREQEARFPKGLHYATIYDTTPFVRESVNEVFHTLRDAVILVAVVILVFLQDWKALLLPVIDVAVSLVGTFAVMSLIGFSLNNLTLFGLVLAIGIVVDDSIVVLENIERWLDKGLPVREATIQAMNEITGPIFAITLVLSSVLVPSAFLGGITGQFFRQFALTISVAMIISAINAMTMTPARAAWIFASRKPDTVGAASRAAPGAPLGSRGLHSGKEALPWWSFALFGGLATAWLLSPMLGTLGRPCDRRRAGSLRGWWNPWQPANDLARVGNLRGLFPSRRARRRNSGLVPHPSSELGTGPSLPRLQLDLRANDPSLRQSRGLVPPPERHRTPDLRRADRSHCFRLHTHPDRLRPHPGQGIPRGEHSTTRFGVAGAHDRRHRRGREDRPRYARRCPYSRDPGHVIRPECQ